MLSLDECRPCECDWDGACACDLECDGVGSGVALVSSLTIFWPTVSYGARLVECRSGGLTMGARLKENLRFMVGDSIGSLVQHLRRAIVRAGRWLIGRRTPGDWRFAGGVRLES
jgi:hypothetical protein